jgi:hypothetical protein
MRLNPAGEAEQRVAEIAAELMPEVPVSLSHIVLPEMQVPKHLGKPAALQVARIVGNVDLPT